MPQLHLPIFPSGLTYINNQIGVEKKDGRIYYFHGLLPVFSHEEKDIESFRYITSQLVQAGNVSQQEIVKAFGVSCISVKRAVSRLRKQGIEGFTRKAKGGTAHVLTAEVAGRAQKVLNEGHSAGEVARQLGLKVSTIRKAIGAGRLQKKK
ncbi:MAG: helix-turn-helix domain-containing protein [Deltaproteobacteria bacterium]